MPYPQHVDDDSYTLLTLPGIKSALERVEEELRIAVKAEEPLLTKLSRHLIDAGGKRIRPSLAIASSQILENNFDSDPNIPKCVSELATCSRKYGTNFNNKYVQFELAFSTFSFTMSELGYPNIYDFMREQIL